MIHPVSRFDRRKVNQKKNGKKKKETAREGRVWRKLSKEYAKTQEAENELRDYA